MGCQSLKKARKSQESVDQDDAEQGRDGDWGGEWDGESAWAGSEDEAWEYEADWDEWVKGRYDGEELTHEEEETLRDEAKDDEPKPLRKACDKALTVAACSKRPVATPARSVPPLHRLPATLNFKAPSETTAVVESSLTELNDDDAMVLNSTTRKKEYMKLDARQQAAATCVV